MTRGPTNTLIITKLAAETVRDPADIIKHLAPEKHVVELVALPKFDRVLLICENKEVSQRMLDLVLQKWPTASISYSIKDNSFSPELQAQLMQQNGADFEEADTMEYLELPSESGSRRFLISPPLSPPPEWDHWNRAEEGPNDKPFHSPEELSHLLWERLGGVSGSTVRKYEEEDNEVDYISKPAILFQDINNGVPAIMLDSVKNGSVNDSNPKTIAKTAMPPPVDP